LPHNLQPNAPAKNAGAEGYGLRKEQGQKLQHVHNAKQAKRPDDIA
jgi:hypothetical protein